MKYKPHPYSDVEMAFPAHVVKHMPPMGTMPDEFQRGDHPACRLVQSLFSGTHSGKQPSMVPREGVEAGVAWRHIVCTLGSYEPMHEHKIAACGFLLNEWFKVFLIDDEVVWIAEGFEVKDGRVVQSENG